MKSIADAAKAAVNGSADSIWFACLERAESPEIEQVLLLEFDAMREAECERLIRSMSKEERALYEIGNE